jgi:hypothetical protein
VSTPDKPDPARGWLYVEKRLDEEEDERIKSLSDDALRAELRQGATDPEKEWSADELLARAEALAPAAPKIAPVVPIRRTWRTLGLLAAACIAMLLLVKLTRGPDIVAHPPTNQELAAAYRTMADESCARRDWVACKASLDEAAKLDPAGESEPRVQTARQAIATGMAGHPPRPGP